MNFMKCVRVPSCRYITLQPTNRAPWSAIALIVRSSLVARRGEARNDRRHQHAGVDARVDELADRAQPLQRMRRSRLEDPPRVLVHRRHAHADRAAGGVESASSSTSRSRTTIGPFRDQADRRSRRARAPRSRRASACSALRLAGSGSVAVPKATCSRVHDGRSSSRAQHVDEVPLDQNHRRELVVRVHLELHVIAAGEAVVAAVRAAAVGVERPLERHALRRGSAPTGRSTSW